MDRREIQKRTIRNELFLGIGDASCHDVVRVNHVENVEQEDDVILDFGTTEPTIAHPEAEKPGEDGRDFHFIPMPTS